jgi:hypothetical protein
MFSWLFTGFGTEEDRTDDTTTVLAQPQLRVTKNARVVLDARRAKPISVTVPHRDATPGIISVNTNWSGEDFLWNVSASADTFAGLFAGRVGPDTATAGFSSSVTASFGKLHAQAEKGFHNSPYWYDLAWQEKGRMLSGLVRHPRTRDLATIKATVARQAEGVEGMRLTFPAFADEEGGTGWAVGQTLDLPASRTEYVNTDAGVRWSAELDEQVPEVGDDPPALVSVVQAPLTAYRTGQAYRQRWNRAVFGPTVNSPLFPGDWVTRTGDVLAGFVPLTGDGDGRPGFSVGAARHAALYRDGRLVTENDQGDIEAELPAGDAAYRLVTSLQRGAPHTLSTSVSAQWTFRSAHVDGERSVPLPLSTVRFTPNLDERNTARAGGLGVLDVHVDRQPGSAAGTNRTLRVEASFDDGRTWRPVPLLGTGAHRIAVLGYPAAAGFVSLRAEAADTRGNTVKQTVLRAYRIG